MGEMKNTLLTRMWATAWEKEQPVNQHEYELDQMRKAMDTLIAISEKLLKEKEALEEENKHLREKLYGRSETWPMREGV